MTGPNDRTAIPTVRKILIGSGDFGLNLYWQSSSLFLLYFYTEVLGLSPVVAGTIYMTALVWDAAIDPIVGALADRTRSRWGPHRPYLIIGALPLAVSFVMLFTLPTLGVGSVVALATVSHFLFRTLYALVAIPYAALFANVTRDSGERATMAGIRMVFALVSGIVIAAVTLPVARLLGGDARGWAILGVGYSGLASVFLWISAAAANQGDERDNAQLQDSVELVRSLWTIALNRPLLIVLGIVLISSFASTFFSKNVLYFFKYVRHDEGFGGTALAIMAAAAALAAPIWARVARSVGKRNALITGLIIYSLGLAFWYLARESSYGVLAGALVLIGIGASSSYVCFWAMLPDTVEYGEWRTGVRTESLLFGFAIFAQKGALGLGAGALGLSLGWIGLVSNAEQSMSTLHGLSLMMTGVPLAGAVASIALASCYTIDSAAHERFMEEIAARKSTFDPHKA